MSKRALIYTAILYISLFSLVIKSQYSSFIIKEIYPYNLNATAAFLSLTNTGIKKYVYFSFEFNKDKIKDNAYFKISTDSAIYQTNIQYLFIEKKPDEIKLGDVAGNYIYYSYIRGMNFRKEKTEQGFDSYIKIEQYYKNNKNTLVIRIDVEQLKGDVSIENLERLPEDNSLNKNIFVSTNYQNNNNGRNNNYPNNYNGKNNFQNNNGRNNNYPNNYNGNNNNYPNNYNGRNNNYPNNYNGKGNNYQNNYNGHNYNHDYNHNSVINNEQRYSNDIYNKYYSYHSHNNNGAESFRIIYGIIMANIWFVIIILYCLINRRKKNTQYAVAINNSV